VLGDTDAHVSGDLDHRGLRGRWGRDPLEALAMADRCGPKAEARARAAGVAVVQGARAREVLPDRFLSVGSMRASEALLVPLHGEAPPEDRAVVLPIRWTPGTQRWVLIDCDDLESVGPEWGGLGVVRRVAEVALAAENEGILSGRVAVVQTSPTGVQAWVELAGDVDDARAWWREDTVRDWYGYLAGDVLAAVHASGRSGGHVDASAAAAGRYGRRPGWRLVDGWLPYRARLLGAAVDTGEVFDAKALRGWLRAVSGP
jgi:hypothetical protein